MGLKIGVMGAGAIGCYVGGMLGAGGADVVLVGRARTRDAVVASGITAVPIRRKARKTRVRFETDAVALRDVDVVLCCVKSQHSEATAKELRDVVKPDALIASLQNGVRNADVLRGVLVGHTVLGSVVGFNVVDKGSGVFAQTTPGGLVVEKSGDARFAELVRVLKKSGIGVRVTTEIRAQQWSKLVVNLNNAISALSNVPTRELVKSAGYRRVIAAVAEEALDVARRAGISVARPGAWVPVALKLPQAAFSVGAMAIHPEARASMWEDLHRGRPTEVDYLNGEIVRVATEKGLEAPFNARLVELVKRAERDAKGSPGMGADALWDAISRRE